MYVPLARGLLAGSPVLVCTVVGFPLGATLTQAKVEETRLAIEAGAREIDMVIPVGMLKGGQYAVVAEDICAWWKQRTLWWIQRTLWWISARCVDQRTAGAVVKVILEMASADPF